MPPHKHTHTTVEQTCRHTTPTIAIRNPPTFRHGKKKRKRCWNNDDNENKKGEDRQNALCIYAQEPMNIRRKHTRGTTADFLSFTSPRFLLRSALNPANVNPRGNCCSVPAMGSTGGSLPEGVGCLNGCSSQESVRCKLKRSVRQHSRRHHIH